jgi:hypothetical protein
MFFATLLYIVLNGTALGGVSGASSKAGIQVFDTFHVGLFDVFVLFIHTVVVELVVSHVLGDGLLHDTS